MNDLWHGGPDEQFVEQALAYARYVAKALGYRLVPFLRVHEKKSQLLAVWKGGERIGYIICKGGQRVDLPLAAGTAKVRSIAKWHAGGVSAEEDPQPAMDPTAARLGMTKWRSCKSSRETRAS